MLKYFVLAGSLLMFGCASYIYFTEKKEMLKVKPVQGKTFEKPVCAKGK